MEKIWIDGTVFGKNSINSMSVKKGDNDLILVLKEEKIMEIEC